MSERVTLIVRECGERTADHCYRYLRTEFSENEVFRLNEEPFSRALRKSLELGISEQREFILCIDADVIPIASELRALVCELQALPKHISEIQGMVYDNLFRVVRPAGNHLYRTSLAAKALACIPPDGASLRPESSMLSRLTRHGNPWYQSRTVVGYHDFEQTYEDIYRKCFLHAKKHEEFCDYLQTLWRSLALESNEFVVAMQALRDASTYLGEVAVGKSFLEDHNRVVVNALGLANQGVLEKMPDPNQLQSHVDAMPSHLKNASIECQRSIHNKIFRSKTALGRRLLSSRIFEKMFS